MANAKIPLECIIILVALGLVVATIAAIIACFAFPMYFGIYLLYACVTGKFCRDGCKETMKQMFKNVDHCYTSLTTCEDMQETIATSPRQVEQGMKGVKQEQDVPPPATYEEVGMAGEVDKSHDIQLTSNEAYGPLHKTNVILTAPNASYGQVQL